MIAPSGSYLTYPHANGFYGDRVALGVAGPHSWIAGVDLSSGACEELIGPEWFAHASSEAVVWFDIALDAQVLVSCSGGRVIARDLRDPGSRVEIVYEVPPGWSLDGLCSISRDGGRVLIVRYSAGVSEIVEVERGTGRVEVLVRHAWYANHAHYCPHDETWIGYSREGPAGNVPDRLWAWHATQAPVGVNVVDQYRLSEGGAGEHVWLGHERWAFNETAAVVVAYGDSPVGPRGVHLVHADGRAPVLISRAARDWHCNISRDGRAVVVDTTGLEGAPGRGWASAGGMSSVVYIDAKTGTRIELAQTEAHDHPFHPHPCFTPDGGAVLYNAVERKQDKSIQHAAVAIVAVPSCDALGETARRPG